MLFGPARARKGQDKGAMKPSRIFNEGSIKGEWVNEACKEDNQKEGPTVTKTR